MTGCTINARVAARQWSMSAAVFLEVRIDLPICQAVTLNALRGDVDVVRYSTTPPNYLIPPPDAAFWALGCSVDRHKHVAVNIDGDHSRRLSSVERILSDLCEANALDPACVIEDSDSVTFHHDAIDRKFPAAYACTYEVQVVVQATESGLSDSVRINRHQSGARRVRSMALCRQLLDANRGNKNGPDDDCG